MESVLFSPIRLNEMTLDNRIVVSPMCQYSARDGNANDWHFMHMGQYLVSGVGLFISEAIAVLPEARITEYCLGLYSDENERALERIVRFWKEYGNVALGMQLGHAGRKASATRPELGTQEVPLGDKGWTAVSSSPIPLRDGWPAPEPLDAAGMERVRKGFVDAARRADRLGFQVLEIHGAHGYLIHQFLSPLTNQRTDGYGGSFDNRIRLALEVFSAIREAWPSSKPLGIRLSATDWIEGGWDVEDTVRLARALSEVGCDFFDVSAGGTAPGAKIPVGPGYQVEFARRVKEGTGLPTMAVGQITDAFQAENIVRSGQADMVALGRAMLFNPHWTWEAARQLGQHPTYPRQYERGHPLVWQYGDHGKTAKPVR